MSERNIEAIHEYWRRISAMDVDGFAEMFADGAIAHDPPNSPPADTDGKRRAFISGIFEMFTKVEGRCEFVKANGDMTAHKFRLEGTTPEGGTQLIEGIDFIRHSEDGRFKELIAFW